MRTMHMCLHTSLCYERPTHTSSKSSGIQGNNYISQASLLLLAICTFCTVTVHLEQIALVLVLYVLVLVPTCS